MAPKLKDHFDRRLVERIAGELQAGWPTLDRARFVAEALDGLDRLERARWEGRRGSVRETLCGGPPVR